MSVLRAPQLTGLGFAHGFSTRQGGVSAPPFASRNLGRASGGDDPRALAENHKRFAELVGYDPERLYDLSQVHSRHVRQVAVGDDPAIVRSEQGDALVAGAGAAVGVRTADCLPLLMADPDTRCVAAVHAGWRGTAAGIVAAGVQALSARSGAPASRLVAAIFPHIRVCCFEVGSEVAEILAEAAHGTHVVHHDRGPKPHVALAELVRLQLSAAGVNPEQIDDVAGCTRCDVERFFSFRRDGKASGRHLAVIVSG